MIQNTDPRDVICEAAGVLRVASQRLAELADMLYDPDGDEQKRTLTSPNMA